MVIFEDLAWFSLFIVIKSNLPLLFLLGLGLCVWVSGSRSDATGPLQGLVKSSDVFLHLLQQWQEDMTLPHKGGTPLSHLETNNTGHQTVTWKSDDIM